MSTTTSPTPYAWTVHVKTMTGLVLDIQCPNFGVGDAGHETAAPRLWPGTATIGDLKRAVAAIRPEWPIERQCLLLPLKTEASRDDVNEDISDGHSMSTVSPAASSRSSSTAAGASDDNNSDDAGSNSDDSDNIERDDEVDDKQHDQYTPLAIDRTIASCGFPGAPSAGAAAAAVFELIIQDIVWSDEDRQVLDRIEDGSAAVDLSNMLLNDSATTAIAWALKQEVCVKVKSARLVHVS
jgi:hypothetical protein